MNQKLSRLEQMQLISEFSETTVLRLMRAKPLSMNHSQAVETRDRLKKLRSFVKAIDNKDIRAGCNTLGKWATPSYYMTEIFYGMSPSRIAKLDLIIEDVDERLSILYQEYQRQEEERNKSRAAALLFANTTLDQHLAGMLWHALETAPPVAGYVYLKRWCLPDGSYWFKVGVTSNPNRRDLEQNVLPVPAETLACVDAGSMDRARAIEYIIHNVLDEQRITDANNRELFHLNDSQAAAIMAILNRIE